MDNEVVLPQQSYDIDSEKPQHVKEEELRADAVHRQFEKEIKDERFPVITRHLQELATAYGDVKELANIQDSAERGVHALAKAWFVAEIETLLRFIEQTGEERDVTGGK